MLELLPEAIGTFVFVSVVLVAKDPIAIGIALIAVIYFVQKLSSASINPAVSTAMWLRGDLTNGAAIGYIVAELIGAGLAYAWYAFWKQRVSSF